MIFYQKVRKLDYTFTDVLRISIKQTIENTRNAFILLVERQGMKRWTTIANILNKNYGCDIKKPPMLKYIWDEYKQNFYQDAFNQDDVRIIIRNIVAFKMNRAAAKEDFYKKTNKMVTQSRYSIQVNTIFKDALMAMVKAFSRRKEYTRRIIQQLSMLSSLRMLESTEIETQDEVLIEIKQSAQNLLDLLMMYSKVVGNDCDIVYDQLSQVSNRQKFTKLIYYLTYVNELRKLSIYSYGDETEFLQAQRHDLLGPSIDASKSTESYQKLFQTKLIREKMFQEYKEANILEPDNIGIVQIQGKPQQMKVKQEVKPIKQPRLTQRGHIHQKDDPKFRGWKSEKFHNELLKDLEEDQQQSEIRNRNKNSSKSKYLLPIELKEYMDNKSLQLVLKEIQAQLLLGEDEEK